MLGNLITIDSFLKTTQFENDLEARANIIGNNKGLCRLEHVLYIIPRSGKDIFFLLSTKLSL